VAARNAQEGKIEHQSNARYDEDKESGFIAIKQGKVAMRFHCRGKSRRRIHPGSRSPRRPASRTACHRQGRQRNTYGFVGCRRPASASRWKELEQPGQWSWRRFDAQASAGRARERKKAARGGGAQEARGDHQGGKGAAKPRAARQPYTNEKDIGRGARQGAEGQRGARL